MSALHREYLLLLVVLLGVVWFIWTHIAADLPDDFFERARSRLDVNEQNKDG